MQDTPAQQNNASRENIDFDTFSLDERQRVVGAFVWLFEQDKKQNPANYQTNKKQNI